MKVVYYAVGIAVLVLVCVWITRPTTCVRKTLPDKTFQKNSKAVINWDKRFSFVPNNILTCSQLFNGNSELPSSFSKDYQGYVSTFQNTTKKRDPGEGYTAQITVAFKAYLELASHSSVKTICETGFNAGHSTFGWLTINPNAHVYSFDIGVHRYAKPMAEYIRKLHPGRFNITWGDSTKTIPIFHRQHPEVLCDLIIIDGGHTTGICKADLLNFKKMANNDSIVILDNYPQKSWKFNQILGDVWEWAKRNGEISEIFRCHVDAKPSDFGFSVGKIINNCC
ncbi:hypothetical protein LSH36_1173g00002 [Paralvinella palmiformis]|jgi:hypothetical protein|uniref:Uncharacterized protein n=1 Tax=Paralvinella palmiformis TaxID=53620 RepID=A0AAD9IU73_9ANNE|nr:hypothetical protein LSH36_1173g00002 [Paralvinella palmiformis]